MHARQLATLLLIAVAFTGVAPLAMAFSGMSAPAPCCENASMTDQRQSAPDCDKQVQGCAMAAACALRCAGQPSSAFFDHRPAQAGDWLTGPVPGVALPVLRASDVSPPFRPPRPSRPS